MKYHLNLETDKTGPCKAVIKCRWGTSSEEHYNSEAEARLAYEVRKAAQVKAKGVAVTFRDSTTFHAGVFIGKTRPLPKN